MLLNHFFRKSVGPGFDVLVLICKNEGCLLPIVMRESIRHARSVLYNSELVVIFQTMPNSFSGFNRTGTFTGLNLTGFGRIETCINCTFQIRNVQISYQGGDGGGGNGTGGGGGGGGGDIDVKRPKPTKSRQKISKIFESLDPQFSV